MYDQSGLLVHEGNPMLPGATKVSGGINFAVEVPADEEASLILYHKGEAEPAEDAITAQISLGAKQIGPAVCVQ